MNNAIEPTKKCFRCQEVKPVSSFHKDKTKKHGVGGECKECSTARSKQRHLDANGGQLAPRKTPEEREAHKKAWHKEYRSTHKETASEYQRQYRIDNEAELRQYRIDNKDRRAKQKKIWYEENKEHVREYERNNWDNTKKARSARHKAARAVINGTLTPLPCVICGEIADKHHHDYDKPLEVLWICTAHHAVLHSYILRYGNEKDAFSAMWLTP